MYWARSLVKLPRQRVEKALAGSLEVFTKWSPLTPDLDTLYRYNDTKALHRSICALLLLSMCTFNSQ